MTTLLLARHGQTDWNLEHRWQGDPPLNDTGRAQARALADALRGEQLDGIYCSDLLRASETAEIIAGQSKLGITVDARLREIDVGEWMGLTSPELQGRYPEGYARYCSGSAGWDEGESYDEMGVRVVEGLRAIALAHPQSRFLVVTHAGVMCSTWLGCGEALADWPGTHNGDVQEVVVEDGVIRWGGLYQEGQRHGDSKPSLFWRV
ncbi:MAG: histidine phosphatase family protein [Actinomycetes bacterium]